MNTAFRSTRHGCDTTLRVVWLTGCRNASDSTDNHSRDIGQTRRPANAWLSFLNCPRRLLLTRMTASSSRQRHGVYLNVQQYLPYAASNLFCPLHILLCRFFTTRRLTYRLVGGVHFIQDDIGAVRAAAARACHRTDSERHYLRRQLPTLPVRCNHATYLPTKQRRCATRFMFYRMPPAAQPACVRLYYTGTLPPRTLSGLRTPTGRRRQNTHPTALSTAAASVVP